MKSKIKQITLIDGKRLFYPSEEEVKKLWQQVETVELIEYMTRDEYDNLYIDMPQFDRSYLTKNGDG